MATWRRDAGPEWPERLTRFRDWEWSADEIDEAASDFARRHAEASGMAEPLSADSWPRHMTPLFAFSYFRMRWAEENGRTQDLVDEMTRRRVERGRRGRVNLEDAT